MQMTINHLVLIGGGHTNVLLMRKWLMYPKSMPEVPISIISRDSHLVYSAMFPSVIAKSISLDDSLIDIKSLAKKARVSFINEEVTKIDFQLKKIYLKNRPSIGYSKLVLNYGSQTKIPGEFKKLVKNQIAFPIKPFFKAYELIKNEDKYDSDTEKPFIVIGSGLAAIEVAFALRKRWKKRSLNILCESNKVDKKILKTLCKSNIEIVKNPPLDYGKILLCTGNSSPSWAQKKLLDSDSHGRIITNQNLQLKSFSGAAADPSCRNQRSLENRMRKKKEAGAGFIQTQMVMERENLIEFCEKISNPLEIPVIAGVFLLKSYKNALFINKYVPGANIPENILNRLKDAKDPLKEGIKIAAEQAHDFFNIANGVHLMAVKAEHLIPEIIEKADLSLEY